MPTSDPRSYDPVYTGEQPGSIRSFFNQLLGIEPGLDRYENVYPEGTENYDKAGDGYSGSVNPIGRREIRYGDAPVQGTPVDPDNPLPWLNPPGRNPTDREFSPTNEEITAEEFGDVGYTGPEKIEPKIKPQYRGDGTERISDANTRLAEADIPDDDVQDMDLTGAFPGPGPGPDAASSLLQNIPPDADSLDNRFIGTGLGGWKPSIPANNTPGSMIQDGASANVPSTDQGDSPFMSWLKGLGSPDIEGAESQAMSLNQPPAPPPVGQDMVGPDAQAMTLTPPPPPPPGQDLPMTPTPLPMNPPVGQGMEGPDTQAMSINQPAGQGMGAGPNAQSMSISPPTLPDAPISNVRPPTVPLNQPPIAPPPPAGPSVRTGGPGGAAGMAGGIGTQQGGFNLMKTIMDLLPSSSPEVAPNTSRFQGASIPSPQPNAIPQTLQDFQSRYGPKR